MSEWPRIYLRDLNPYLVGEWRAAFDGINFVSAACGTFFGHAAKAVVSPANSFGIMDGGLDLLIRDKLGGALQKAVTVRLAQERCGELAIGDAIVVTAGHREWPFLVVAPTMRVPEDVSSTINAYLAFRAALTAVVLFNRKHGNVIDSMLVPGLCTGTGRMHPRACARQMRMALDSVMAGGATTFAEIHAAHAALRETVTVSRETE